MGYPGQAARTRKTGNRHTGRSLTARQAQTIVNCIMKLNKIQDDLDMAWADYTIHQARTALVKIIVRGDRMDEITPESVRGR